MISFPARRSFNIVPILEDESSFFPNELIRSPIPPLELGAFEGVSALPPPKIEPNKPPPAPPLIAFPTVFAIITPAAIFPKVPNILIDYPLILNGKVIIPLS